MALRLLPLGGLGEIGMNCLLVEREGEAILVDCGVRFPGAEAHGVDLVIPDFRPLLARRERLRALFLTHGHEDHIGAVPYLLREIPELPVYGTRFTLALLRQKLDELLLAGDLREMVPRVTIALGGFEVEPLRVAHSIPDGVALAIATPEGVVIHTGDFKLDPDPLDGERTDLERLGQLGERGVLCLLSDSTNALVPGHCPGERTVGPALERAIAEAPGRVVTALFASHVHRIQRLFELAGAAGRKVTLNGRSLEQNVAAAAAVGKLAMPPGLLVGQEEAAQLAPRRLLVLATGAQGEPRSGLARLASGTHPRLHLEPGDRVIFSSRVIPGHEVAVAALQNAFARLGVDSFGEPIHAVHVSGHAYSGDEREVIARTRPRSFVPIHGEARHLRAHREIAIAAGVPAERCLVAYDGEVIELGEVPRVVKRVDLGKVFIDRWGGGDVPEGLLRDRRTLAESGLVVAFLVIDGVTGVLERPPELFSRGVAVPDPDRFWKEARRAVQDELDALAPELRADAAAVEDAATRALRRHCKKQLERRPLVMPVVLSL
ncbi:MAG: ribonuclease J [Myxococcales bacterium]